MQTRPIQFIDEPIQVEYDQPPAREKAPDCPNRFTWRGQVYQVTMLLEEWSDFTRRGRMGRNMRPAHLSRAERVGSRGVGRYYFRVRVSGERIMEIYFDRAPSSVDDRKGNWFLLGERETQAETSIE